MDIAIIVETRPAPVEAVVRDAVDELRGQLAGLGWPVTTVHVTADGPAVLADVAAAAADASRVAVVDARLVGHASALRALLADPRVTSGLLVAGRAGDVDAARAVRVDRDAAVVVGSPLAPATGAAASVGVCVTPADPSSPLDAAFTRLHGDVGADDLADAMARGPVEVVAASLLAAGRTLTAVDVRGLVAVRAEDAAEVEAARARRDDVDEDRAWLDAAVKAHDGFFTTFLVSPYSRFVARWAARHDLTPNQVTLVSLVLGVLAAGLFASGQRWAAVAGAIALQLSFTADCVDGQLARYTQRFSAFGAWLDAMFDRTKEYVVFAGLAVGAADPAVWFLAAAALTLQVVRHALDFGFGTARPEAAALRPVVATVEDGGAPPATDEGGARPSRVLSAAGRAERVPGLRWAKRVVAFPIGERFAVISLTAAVSTARVTFTVLLLWGAVAAAYTAVGRLLRARRW